MIANCLSLVLAALLEVGGDAAIRRGLVRTAAAWVVLGCAALAGYGLTVNLNRELAFGRLMGIYIAVFFVVSQGISIGILGERPTPSLLLGGALIVGGGIVIQLGTR